MSEFGTASESETKLRSIKSRLSGFMKRSSPPEIPQPNYAEHVELNVEEELQRVKMLAGIPEALAAEPGQEQFVHANPSLEVANLINKNGLYCGRSGMSGVAQRIPDGAEDQYHPFVFRHKDFRFNNVITLPEFPKDLHQAMMAHNRELGLDLNRAKLLRRALPENKKTGGGYFRRYDMYLPARYIKGYLDITEGNFTRNENFAPLIDQTEHDRIQQILESINSDSYQEYL